MQPYREANDCQLYASRTCGDAAEQSGELVVRMGIELIRWREMGNAIAEDGELIAPGDGIAQTLRLHSIRVIRS